MTFAEKVKYLRSKLYISQETLAKKLGVSFPTVNRWENNHAKPNLITKSKFYDFCENNGIKFEE